VSKPFTLHYTADITKSMPYEMWGFSWYWP